MKCKETKINIKKDAIKSHHFLQFGGELEIRTLAGLSPPAGFQDQSLQPLG